MNSAKNGLPQIAVVRGGVVRHAESLDEGVLFLASLSKLGYEPIDIVIDKEGNWNHKGLPTDSHAIFTKAEGYVDTTGMYDAAHHTLAKKMGIRNLLLQGDLLGEGDRESVYRVLRQRGVEVPETYTFRHKEEIAPQKLREAWVRLHTPLLVRSLYKTNESPAVLVRSFQKLLTTVEDFHKKGLDVHVLTYVNTPVYTLAVLPDYRGEHRYIPIPVVVFPEKDEVPHQTLSVYHHTKSQIEEKALMRGVVHDVLDALDLHTPVTIDIIKTKKGFIVVNIDTKPSLREGGRFMQALSTTGVDIGHYAQSRLFL